MSILSRTRVFGLIIAFLLATPAILAAETASSEEFAFKIAVESHLENRLNSVLSEIAGTDEILVIVNADVKTDVKKKPRVTSRKVPTNRSNRLVLPGVPIKKELGKEKTIDTPAPDLPSISALVNRLDVIILIDNDVPESMTEIAHDVAIAVIGYNPDRGDRLNVKRFEFGTEQFEWATIIHPPNLYWILGIGIAGFFLVAAALFFLNPFKKLASSIDGINWKPIFGGSPKVEQDTSKPTVSSVNITSTPPLPSLSSDRKDTTESGKPMPFAYIDENNINELAFLLRDVTPQDIAVVVNYVSPDQATRLMELIPSDQATEVALHLSSARLADATRVERLDNQLKERLDYVVGGGEKLASILSLTPEDIRDKVVEELEKQSADAADRVKQKIKTFESIIRGAQPLTIQVLHRHLDMTNLARVLKSSPGDIQTKVIESLSEGAGQMLREEMDLSRPFNPARMRKEKLNIVMTYRRLLNAGLIEEDEV
jgi:hypothetical protein